MADPSAVRRFTVREYRRMAETGILKPEDRVELLEGEVVRMTPIRERHASRVDALNELLVKRAGRRAVVRVQNPIRLGSFSEPQPDFALAKPRKDRYTFAHPGPAEILLVIEVSDTTYDRDRQRKIPLYARYGVPEVWLVDLDHGRLEVHRDPGRGGYRDIRTLSGKGRIAPTALPRVSFTVKELLG